MSFAALASNIFSPSACTSLPYIYAKGGGALATSLITLYKNKNWGGLRSKCRFQKERHVFNMYIYIGLLHRNPKNSRKSSKELHSTILFLSLSLFSFFFSPMGSKSQSTHYSHMQWIEHFSNRISYAIWLMRFFTFWNWIGK